MGNRPLLCQVIIHPRSSQMTNHIQMILNFREKSDTVLKFFKKWQVDKMYFLLFI